MPAHCVAQLKPANKPPTHKRQNSTRISVADNDNRGQKRFNIELPRSQNTKGNNTVIGKLDIARSPDRVLNSTYVDMAHAKTSVPTIANTAVLRTRLSVSVFGVSTRSGVCDNWASSPLPSVYEMSVQWKPDRIYYCRSSHSHQISHHNTVPKWQRSPVEAHPAKAQCQ